MDTEERQHRSALIKAAQEGTVRISAAFGGQGPNNINCLNELFELNQVYGPILSDLIQTAATALSELSTIPHRSGFHEDIGFNIKQWLIDPTSAPDKEYLGLAPMSFPINTILSLANYCIACKKLNLDPGQLRSSLHSVVGHSQGLFAALVVTKSDSWNSFYEACDASIRISFWVGLFSHCSAPRAKLSAVASGDCTDHGEGQPSSMLSISGLTKSQIVSLINKVNKSLGREEELVHLALINSRSKFVLAGPPQSLRVVCMHIREMKATETQDQSRILFHKRKPSVDAYFLPISAPFHSPYLEQVDRYVVEQLSSICINGNDLGLPFYHTNTGQNLQEWKSEDILKTLIRAVTVDMVDWPKLCNTLKSTHLLDFGPGSIGSLVYDITDGTGLRIIQMTDQSSSYKDIGTSTEFFSAKMPPIPTNWKKLFGPQLVANQNGTVRIQTRMTDVFGTPPVIVAGMTPTTVPWDFVASVTKSGYHIELAGGGYSNKHKFEAAIRKLASEIPAHRGITCNLLYANPQTIAWQVSLLRELVREGIPIFGLTIGAGVPSADVVKDYIESIGLKHISFKPGSIASIEQVISIAQQYPDFPIGMQWTGGRAGGHHSFEDFHQPILKTYGRIRKCTNIILIAGSGFGGGSDTFPYLTGEWSSQFGYTPMPFDGVLLGSRMMVAKEAHTSIQAKQLIIQAEGVSESEWHKSFDEPTGGVVTINSEMGQPIHMLATRGVMLWKEFDQRIFSISDSQQRLKYLRLHRDEIVRRLNDDFARPWFAVNEHGENIEIEDMTYSEILRRSCQLMYVHQQNRWIDPSYLYLVHDFIHLCEERFNIYIQRIGEQPKDIIGLFETAFGSDAKELVYPEDESLLMSLFRRRGQKPVPFIPKLDANFETWFKKDSLWQSEDVEAVFDQDAQRICIIHGPVAARYSKSCDESAKTILDTICQEHIELLKKSSDNFTAVYIERAMKKETIPNGFPSVRVTNDRLTKKFELLKDRELPSVDLLIDYFIGPSLSWIRSCLKNEWVLSSKGRVENPIRRAFKPKPGDVVEVRFTKDSAIQEVALYPGSLGDESHLCTTFKITSKNTQHITVTVAPPNFLGRKRPIAEFNFESRLVLENFEIHECDLDRIDKVKELYAQLWIGSPLKSFHMSGLNSEFSGKEKVILQDEVQDYMNVISRTSPSKLQAWNPDGFVPLDYCIVVAWTALIKPLMIPAVNCDLLRLLHRSISFKYVQPGKLLKYGDVVRTISRITSLTIQPTGKLIEISAEIRRDDEPVIAIKTDFFIQGKFRDYEKQFKSVEEPEMIVDVQSPVVFALLTSRKWLIFENSSPDLIGKRLIFNLTTHTMFNHEGKIALLQVSGTVRTAGHDSTPTRLGRVYFEEDSCSGNPVIDFLQRNGTPCVNRQILGSPGWTEGPTMLVRAPAKSAPYSKVSYDTNPIHVCSLFARYAGLPGTVVHGMNTSAIVRRYVEWAVGDVDCSRFKSWQVSFEGMVRSNDLLRIELQHIAMEEGRMVFKIQAFNDKTSDKIVEAEAEIEQPPTGYVFCGQGSQEKGMGMSLYATKPEAKALWDRGDSYLREHYGFSLLEIVRDNPQTLTISFGGKRGRRIRDNYLAMTKKSSQLGVTSEESILNGLTPKSTSYTFSYPKGLLFSTQFSQPALALMEMVEYEQLKAQGVVQSDALFAGHSLGEYAALGSCTTFMSFENLLTLIFYRGLKMQNALQRDAQGRTDYSMVAADPSRVGKDFDEEAFQRVVRVIAQETGLLLEVVNHNIRSQQYVCAGHFRSLWLLGKVCDDLASYPKPHLVNENELLEIIRHKIEAAEELSNDVTLERGRSTIPLSGIDIPFHSTMLRGEIPHYRDYIMGKVQAADIKPSELVNRWIPNVVGKPFSLDRSYVELVQKITGSKQLQKLMCVMDGEQGRSRYQSCRS